MLTNYFHLVSFQEWLRSGQTGPFIEGFAQSLKEMGYSRQTIRIHLSVASHFGHWTQDKSIAITEFDENVGRKFRRHLTCCKCPVKGHQVLRS